MFWATDDPVATIKDVKEFGFRAGQLGLGGDLVLGNDAVEKWDRVLTDEQFTAVTAVCSYGGENYANIPVITETVGLVPESTRSERVKRTKEVSDFASKLGIDNVACHIGVISHDFGDAAFLAIRDVARELCDHCQANGQSFTLETGQEPAKVLLGFIETVNRPNLKINFDPANMILYGTGDPIEALAVVAKYVVSVHCKDGNWPPLDKPAALGIEQPLGEGSVDLPAFISKLKEIGYRGLLSIEREESDEKKRAADIRKASQLLRKLVSGEQATA